LKAETFELADTSALQALSVTTVEVVRAEPRTLPGAEHVVADFRGCGGRRRRRLCGARGGRLPRRKCGWRLTSSSSAVLDRPVRFPPPPLC